MKLPFLHHAAPGWLGVHLDAGRVSLVHAVRTGEKIAVTLAYEEPPATADFAALRKSLSLGRRWVCLLMPPGGYQIIQLEAPAVPREEWREAIRWKLKDALDFPVDEAICDVLEIPTEQYAPGRPRQCFAVVARRQAVAERIAPLQSGGVDLNAVDVPEVALRNVAALLAEENRGIALLAFDEGGAFLVVCFKGELYAARRMETPPAQLQGNDGERRRQACERIALETQRTLDAFDRQYSFMTISRLVVAPWQGMEGLKEALTANLYVAVDSLDLSAAVDFSAAPALRAPAAQARWLLPLGAALRENPA